VREKMETTWISILGAFALPILGIILLLVPWKKLKKTVHYPLDPDGLDKKAKAYASDTIYMSYMEQRPSIEKDASSSNKNNSR
jgi:hypothetical protein